MKTKSIKMISVLIIAFLAVILLGTTNVKATDESELKVTAKNTLTEGAIKADNAILFTDSNKAYIYLELDTDKLYKLLTNSENLQNINGYVYDILEIEVWENVDKVELTQAGNTEELEIINKNGKKYIDYKIKLFEKNASVENKWKFITAIDEDVQSSSRLLKMYNGTTVVSERKIEFGLGLPKTYGSFAICGENGKVLSGFEGHGDASYMSHSTPTNYDYSKCHYVLAFERYVGKTVNIAEMGTFEYERMGTLEYEFDSEWNQNNMYIYKCNITNPKQFNKEGQSKEYSCTYTLEDIKLTKTLKFSLGANGNPWWFDNCVCGNLNVGVGTFSNSSLKLEVENITEDSDVYAGLQIYKNIYDTCLYMVDISLTGGEYHGDITVTFEVGEQYNGKQIKVYHKKKNGTVENFAETVKDGKVTITVSELSPFMLTLAGKSTSSSGSSSSSGNTETNNTPNTENKNDNTNNNTGNTGTSNKAELDETPKTGDNIYEVCTLLAVIIIANVGLIIYRIKK